MTDHSVLPKWLGEMLRAIADLHRDGFHEPTVHEVLCGLIHPLLADERCPSQILIAEDALDVALGVAERKRHITEAKMAIREVASQDAPDVNGNGVVLRLGLRTGGHRPVVAQRSGGIGTAGPTAPCQRFSGSFLASSL